MKSFLSRLNPFGPLQDEKIQTPWGSLEPSVDIFPLTYLAIMYGVVYFLPLGVFKWLGYEDGPLEWLQFAAYLGAFLCACVVLWRRRNAGLTKTWFIWLGLALICFFVAGEEISWGERVFGIGADSLRHINAQGESNLHNSQFIQDHLLHSSFILIGLFFGWVGWRVWPQIDAFPAKRFSLFFLTVALYYAYHAISEVDTSSFFIIRMVRDYFDIASGQGRLPLRNEEVFESLMAFGLLAHCWHNAFPRKPV